MIAIASNRGLCGGYNGSIVRATVLTLREAKAAGKEVTLIVSGRKLASALRFQGFPPTTVHTTFEDKPTRAFQLGQALSEPRLDCACEISRRQGVIESN